MSGEFRSHLFPSRPIADYRVFEVWIPTPIAMCQGGLGPLPVISLRDGSRYISTNFEESPKTARSRTGFTL